jgi:hypothetical protein
MQRRKSSQSPKKSPKSSRKSSPKRTSKTSPRRSSPKKSPVRGRRIAPFPVDYSNKTKSNLQELYDQVKTYLQNNI